MNNLKTKKDALNTILVVILWAVIKTINFTQHVKMGYYNIRGIDYEMNTDHKFGKKYCSRKDKK